MHILFVSWNHPQRQTTHSQCFHLTFEIQRQNHIITFNTIQKKMENLINQQRRVRFSESGHGDLSSIGDGKTPQGGRKGKTWFQTQFSGQSSLDQEPMSSEYAAAVAASAFSIHSSVVAEEQNRKKIRDEFEASRDKIKSMTIDVKSPGVSRRSSSKETEVSTRKVSESRLPQQAKTTPRAVTGNGHPNQMQSRSNAWERAQMDKIRKRNEKLKSNIVKWENEKKLKAKVSVEKKKSEIEERKARTDLHYQSKVARIESIAKGARAQADEKRRSEEARVKAKAKKIRSGKDSVNYCFCF